jgi:intracellular septation protein
MTWVWASFFVAIGILNLWVAFTFDTDTWVNFKLVGLMGLLLVFIIAQSFYLYRLAAKYPDPEETDNETQKQAQPLDTTADNLGNTHLANSHSTPTLTKEH